MNWNKSAQTIVFLMRIALGCLFIYDGFWKLTTTDWSPLSYLQDAQTFTSFYQWLATDANIGWVTILNIWGPLLIGIAILIGFRTRFAALCGIVLMALYYFPTLNFPYLTSTGYIFDRHIIYGLVFALLYVTHAGEFWGLDAKVEVIVKT